MLFRAESRLRGVRTKVLWTPEDGIEWDPEPSAHSFPSILLLQSCWLALVLTQVVPTHSSPHWLWTSGLLETEERIWERPRKWDKAEMKVAGRAPLRRAYWV